jgi:type IV pilus assembly protein PilB
MVGWRDLGRDAMTRLLEDLHLEPDARVLVVDPVSAYLPVVLGAVAKHVDVVAPAAWRAGQLADQLSRSPVTNVHLCTYAPTASDDADLYDAIVVVQPCGKEVPPDLICLLAPGAALVAPLDAQSPPRRMRRVLRTDEGDLLEEELDFASFRPLLGDMLVERGLVLQQSIAEALRSAKASGLPLGQELVQRGQLREDDLYRLLAEQRSMAFTDTGRVLARIDLELVRLLPRKYLDHYGFVPVCESEGRILVATTNLDLPIWDLRGVFDGAEVVAELIAPIDMSRIWTAIELGFVARPSAPAAKVEAAAAPAAVATEDSRVEGLFEAILVDAVAERASDIHLEVYDTGVRLRFRVDGSLRDVSRYSLDGPDATQLINVIKLAAQLDIAERRVPQGGRVQCRKTCLKLDLRVQTQPTLYHESVVIRLLPQDERPPSIEELGFAAEVAGRYRRLLQEPRGLILVVGPTGSGKSTTLYAGLQLLAADTTRKVITVEDPIEYSIPGVQQTQVNPIIGVHFADAMRAFVREDPDVILLGEIRDGETALEAIRAAQTGHLVLASLHCNDGVDAVQRLTDLGMHRSSVASELSAVIAQRLARRICTECREEAKPDVALLAELFPRGTPAGWKSWRGRGCTRCGGTGARGRISVVELLRCDAVLRRAIARGSDVDELRSLVQTAGNRTLRDSALDLVQRGVIAASELYDVLSSEQMRPSAP